jgi:hypothetical protein
VAFVKTDVLEERISSIIRATRIGEIRTTLAVSSNRITLRRSINYMRREAIEWYITERVRGKANSCHADDVGDTLLRNVGSYMSQTA